MAYQRIESIASKNGLQRLFFCCARAFYNKMTYVLLEQPLRSTYYNELA